MICLTCTVKTQIHYIIDLLICGLKYVLFHDSDTIKIFDVHSNTRDFLPNQAILFSQFLDNVHLCRLSWKNDLYRTHKQSPWKGWHEETSDVSFMLWNISSLFQTKTQKIFQCSSPFSNFIKSTLKALQKAVWFYQDWTGCQCSW